MGIPSGRAISLFTYMNHSPLLYSLSSKQPLTVSVGEFSPPHAKFISGFSAAVKTASRGRVSLVEPATPGFRVHTYSCRCGKFIETINYAGLLYIYVCIYVLSEEQNSSV